jgi:hypothetical protein
MPIFWDAEELALLQGSYMLEQVSCSMLKVKSMTTFTVLSKLLVILDC